MNNKSLFDLSSLNPNLILKEYENILPKHKSKEAVYEWLNKSIYSYYNSECEIYSICTIVELLFRDGYITLSDVFSILRNYHSKPYYDSSIFIMIIKHIMTIHSNNSSLTEEYYIKICEFFNDSIVDKKFVENIGYIEIKQCSNISEDDFVTLYNIMDSISIGKTEYKHYELFNTDVILLLLSYKSFDVIQRLCDRFYIVNNYMTQSKLDKNMIISLLLNVDISDEVPYLIKYCSVYYSNDIALICTILSNYWYRQVYDSLSPSIKDTLKKSKEFKKLILKKGEFL